MKCESSQRSQIQRLAVHKELRGVFLCMARHSAMSSPCCYVQVHHRGGINQI